MTDYEAYLEEIADEDYSEAPHCEICGAKLVKIIERGEARGSQYCQEYWQCPECD